ncbi:MAG: beta-ketoacyl synthase N-terminal-like domain-containing protein [Janthinobacterium lividum]
MDGIGFGGGDGEKTGSSATRPVAIVGASCRFPGALNLAALRQLLREDRDAVTQIPDDRWAKPLYFHPYSGQRGGFYTFAAGVLDNVYGFGAYSFSISPREAAQMDPQQQLCHAWTKLPSPAHSTKRVASSVSST